MEQKTFLSPLIKAILIFTIIFLTGILLIFISNPFGNLFKKAFAPTPAPATTSVINKIEISADQKSILDAKTKEILFTIDDTKKYLKSSGYFYNPNTFQTTNTKYEGDCFLASALSNNKDRIVFSIGCLPGDLPQAWIGVYDIPDVCAPTAYPDGECHPLEKINFLIASSGRNFVWSQDDKTITYDADLGLSGMTEIRTIDSVTGEIGETKLVAKSFLENSKKIKIDASGRKTYRNEEYGFEIKYPDAFIVKENINLEKSGIGGLMAGGLAIDKNLIGFPIIEVSQFDDYYKFPSLVIHISGGKEPISRCLTEYANSEIVNLKESKNINGMIFYKEYMVDSMANDSDNPTDIQSVSSEFNSYRSIYQNKCYQITLYNFSASYMSEKEKADLKERLGIINQILSTFKFIEKDETADWKTYRNEEYRFEIILPDSWEGYSVLTEFWRGNTLDGNSTQYQGPQIILRNPKWNTNQPWQDIPLMIFTKEEWALIGAEILGVSAAPYGPTKLGENQKYVFALPPRWIGFTDALGQDEAREIVKTFEVFQF